MLKALAALFGAGLTVAACYGAGAFALAKLGIRLRRGEKFPLAFLLGAASVHFLIVCVMALRIAYKPVWLVLFGAIIVLSARNWKKDADEPQEGLPTELRIVFAVIFATFTVLYFVNAWAPEMSPDGSGYHLDIVNRYFRAHGFVRIPTNMYSSLSQGIEMLYQPAFALGRHSAAALVHFAFLLSLPLAMLAYGRRIGKPWAGAAGALLVYLSPIVGRDGTTAYIDVAVAAIVFGVFYFLELWDEQRTTPLLIAAGLLAGYAYAAKYTAFVMVPYALGFVAWRAWKSRSPMLGPLIILASCSALMIAPWVLKNWIYVHNPIAPFANDIFRNPYVHVIKEKEWTEWLRRYGVANLWTLPVEVTVDGGQTQGIIGPVFLLAPLSLLALRYKAGRRLLVPGLILLATYFGNIGTRFLIPTLPFFSLAMALAVENVRMLLAAVVVFHAVASWPSQITDYSNQYVWRILRFPYRAALRIMPEDAYLGMYLPEIEISHLVESKVPAGERVFSLNGFSESYTSREVIEGFQGALNNTLNDFLTSGWLEDWQPTRLFVFSFPERGVRRLRLLQTARGRGFEQWNVHELRFFDHGVELPRSRDWRLRAWPNPWDVQLAFDNSEATRWRSWETGAPGMYLDVDFGSERKVDEVRMETSRDFPWAMHFEVQVMDSDSWTSIADKYEERTVQPRGSLRRAATYEVRSRGVNYILIQDGDMGADDFKDDPESWGLEVCGQTARATLYRILP
ncbi:MAG TPA: discoidin domain-containing protein [Bryobacteraceae bacterium]|nr:discoidin domain-containing protein [Bryobacteraceae bacterium]